MENDLLQNNGELLEKREYFSQAIKKNPQVTNRIRNLAGKCKKKDFFIHLHDGV